MQDLVVIINALNVFLSVKQIVRIDDILDRGTGEKWFVSRYILKMEIKGFADYLHVEYKKKR